MIGIIYYLEKKKIITKLIDRGFSIYFNKHQTKAQNILAGSQITSNYVETTKECPNCGAIVSLRNGKGTCASCDTRF